MNQPVDIGFADYLQISQLYADLPRRWIPATGTCGPIFTEDCIYKLIARENHERGFPLATLMFESKGMLKDRVYGIRETLFHDPYFRHHEVGAPPVRKAEGDRFESEANYAVFRTKLSQASTVFNVGRNLHEIVRMPEGLKFAWRPCVYDSEMIPNSIIYLN
jgi:salicylate 5-hydroxylase small subunit